MKKLLVISLLLSVGIGYGIPAAKPVGTINTTKGTTPNATHKAVVKAAQEHVAQITAEIVTKSAPQIKAVVNNIATSTKAIQQNTGITTDDLKKGAAQLKDNVTKMTPHIANIFALGPNVEPYIKNIHANLKFAHNHFAEHVLKVQDAIIPLIMIAQQEIMAEKDYIKQVAIALRHFGELALTISKSLDQITKPEHANPEHVNEDV